MKKLKMFLIPWAVVGLIASSAALGYSVGTMVKLISENQQEEDLYTYGEVPESYPDLSADGK